MNITNNDLLDYLKNLPLEDFEPDTYVFGIKNPKNRLTFHNARVIPFPNSPGALPTYIIISTPTSVHIFDNSEVAYYTNYP